MPHFLRHLHSWLLLKLGFSQTRFQLHSDRLCGSGPLGLILKRLLFLRKVYTPLPKIADFCIYRVKNPTNFRLH